MFEIPAQHDPARNWRLLNTNFSFFGFKKYMPGIVFVHIRRGQQIRRQLPLKKIVCYS